MKRLQPEQSDDVAVRGHRTFWPSGRSTRIQDYRRVILVDRRIRQAAVGRAGEGAKVAFDFEHRDRKTQLSEPVCALAIHDQEPGLRVLEGEADLLWSPPAVQGHHA